MYYRNPKLFICPKYYLSIIYNLQTNNMQSLFTTTGMTMKVNPITNVRNGTNVRPSTRGMTTNVVQPRAVNNVDVKMSMQGSGAQKQFVLKSNFGLEKSSQQRNPVLNSKSNVTMSMSSSSNYSVNPSGQGSVDTSNWGKVQPI